ncbi:MULTISPECIES: type I-E CRISPR-associated protein Cse1/CasA [unclassified Streptomyces]|uniref:type I-E CRISPR-associated protein Cse1/CasA n=1 Tax=unclassified Streptomyces TaxID=2593676 RepID=UPI0016604EE4|nr:MULTISPECIES: type I-E CRISPR-associated protein Cse1/CasA [unclassified Streptomyces]MBD0708218.1 type I-E CRISPR-associated protein Cse1/CasA [Streptomyces sp. CBMA291]MBD0717787.1 type I-E CRISPR-associated protein Cse1/CasA [Streptomyces sp. CBMA370]
MNPHPSDSSAPSLLPSTLSAPARSAWAKHDHDSGGWLPLWRHLADAGAMGGKLWDDWLPRSVKRLVSESFPGGEDEARRVIRFLAASHDAGKCTPSFACQVEPLAGPMRDQGLEMLTLKEYGQERRLAPHGLAGQVILQDWMRDRFGLGARASGQLAVVAGGHHGVPPESRQIHDLQLRPHLLRHTGPSEEVWRRTQYELLDWCAELTDVTDDLSSFGKVRLPQPVQVLMTAVVILADWIASAPELFPYASESWQPEGPRGEARRLRAAWKGLELTEPWQPEQSGLAPEELFARRFPHLAGTGLRPVQSEAVRLAGEMEPQGLLIIEAPMGEGKTEAALAAAEVLAARSGAGGLLLALPTRATGDAMFGRLLSWLEALPRDGSRSWSVVLAHAKAVLQSEWAGLLRAGSRAITAVDPDADERGPVRRGRRPSGLHAHQWLRGRKKQLLASFAVGTVDQVLFSALKSRHLALRHLAVAGKVVVIDEVHAYDAYMNRYLDRALEWLAAYRVPVVLLSATLPAARRHALATAYAGAEGAADVETDEAAYPLLTAVSPGRRALSARPAAASGRGVEVVVERLDDDPAVLADRLEAELADGGCALVVRNTVARVMEVADVLRKRFGDDMVTVTHSRFLAADRASNDARLVSRFGPGGRRPERHVVVASQVVEQSLDVNFDLLVTDLAPVDLVLQRMGRLHRHATPRPSRLATPRCLITGVSDWGASPPRPVKGSRAVYRGDWTLLRALAVLGPHLDGTPLRLPGDISPLVQRAYGDAPVGPPGWAGELAAAGQRHRDLLKSKRDRADGFLLGPVRPAGRPVYGWLEAHAGDADDSPEGRAQVRDSQDSLEVLVVQRTADGRLTTVPWLEGGRGGMELPTASPPSRRASEAVAASALTLPGRFSHPGVIDRTISELERSLILAWQVKECPWLAGELLLILDARCQTRLAGYELSYSPVDGLRFAEPGAPASGGGGTDGEKGHAHAAEARQRSSGAPGSSGSGSGERVTASGAQPGEKGDEVGASVAEVSALAAEEERDTTVTAPPAFDLARDPWIPAQRTGDGEVVDLSLRDVFAHAGALRGIVGDVPTQDFALLRLALAVLHDALGGPADLDDWVDLWEEDDPFAKAVEYLDRHAERFGLLDEKRPFFQVPGLRTEKGDVASLGRIVADVPTGSALFSMRRPEVRRISFAEAARWLVHAHAFDVSGIKPAMRDDPRGKAGKVYPLGVGALGGLGGVFAEGATLRETLLLNLIPFEYAYGGSGFADTIEEDLPVWRREKPHGPGPRGTEGGGPHPVGLRDLYTWQSRRIRLVADGTGVTGVVLGYGDPLLQESPWLLEPMSAWRRSAFQEKKRQRPVYYTPQRHDPRRSAWRGLGALLPATSDTEAVGARGPREELPPGVVRWLVEAVTEAGITPDTLVRLRTVGMEYGTQQSVVDEIAADAVVLPVIALHARNPAFGAAAVDAVDDAHQAVRALARLAANLVRAAGGSQTDAAAETARDLGFGALDGPYRAWLRQLTRHHDLRAARQDWRETVRGLVLRLARQEIRGAGPAAAEGRMVDLPGGQGPTLLDAGRAELWFAASLRKVLGAPDRQPPG